MIPEVSKFTYEPAISGPDSKREPDPLREQILVAMDLEWVHYLAALEELRQGIGLRAFGGQKPLQAYGVEAGKLWHDFQFSIRRQFQNLLFST